jgi:hypothetical protein
MAKKLWGTICPKDKARKAQTTCKNCDECKGYSEKAWVDCNLAKTVFKQPGDDNRKFPRR